MDKRENQTRGKPDRFYPRRSYGSQNQTQNQTSFCRKSRQGKPRPDAGRRAITRQKPDGSTQTETRQEITDSRKRRPYGGFRENQTGCLVIRRGDRGKWHE